MNCNSPCIPLEYQPKTIKKSKLLTLIKKSLLSYKIYGAEDSVKFK